MAGSISRNLVMKELKLTGDEYDALECVRRGAKSDRVNACVGRNAKRLSGLKLIQYAKNGSLALTVQGREMLFLRRCVQALHALEADPQAALDEDVIQFLSRKSHIAARAEGGFTLTARGRESLADIAGRAA
jgi:Mn-dependent DtxR family transcriptional regulator